MRIQIIHKIYLKHFIYDFLAMTYYWFLEVVLKWWLCSENMITLFEAVCMKAITFLVSFPSWKYEEANQNSAYHIIDICHDTTIKTRKIKGLGNHCRICSGSCNNKALLFVFLPRKRQMTVQLSYSKYLGTVWFTLLYP